MKKTTKIHINPTKCQNKPNKNYRATGIELSTNSRGGSNFLSPSCVCGRLDAANFRPCRFLSEGGGGVGGCVIMLIYSKAQVKKLHHQAQISLESYRENMIHLPG